MQKLFRAFLSAGRKRRGLTVGVALWLLRQVRDVEKDEAWRASDKLDSFDWKPDAITRRAYSVVEDDYLSCEHSLDVLESAIDDLEFAY